MIYSHEHVVIDLSGTKGDPDCRLDETSLIVEEFFSLRERGVTHVADVTNRGMGRDAEAARKVAEKSGVRVLHATGWYKEGFFPPEVYSADVTELARILRGELERGIDGGGIKASVIGEIGTEADRITPEEERVFAAAARVQAETGCPVITHATMGRMGSEQLDLLEKHGADLSRVTVSHVDLTGDTDYILRLTDRGATVGFDTVGKNAYLDDAIRVKMLKELSRRGRCGFVVLSMDITRRSHLKACGGPGYLYLIDSFLPRLRVTDETGPAVSEKHIGMMTRGNAARLFGLSGGGGCL